MPENYDEMLNNQTFEEAVTPPPPQGVYPPALSPEELAKKDEKKKLWEIGNIAGLSLSLIVATAFLLSFPIALLAFLGIDLFSNPAISQIYQILLSIILFTLPFIICFKAKGFRISELMSFSKPQKGKALPMIFLGLSFCAFANIGSAYVDSFFSSVGIDYSITPSDLPEGVFGFILSTLGIAVVPALVEEFALRGIVLGSLRRFGDSFALVASSICFGVMHGNFEQMPFAAMVGLFLGYSVIKTGSLRIAILVHFLNNFISVLFSYFPSSLPVEIGNVIYVFYLITVLTVGILLLSRVESDFFTLSKGDSLLTEKEKYKKFFLSAGIIVFLVLNLLEAMSFIFI